MVKYGMACNPTDTITQGKWNSLQSKSEAWTGLDKFGDVYDTTEWKNVFEKLFYFCICY